MMVKGLLKKLAVLGIAGVISLNAAAGDAAPAAEPTPAVAEKSECSCKQNFYNMGRGLTNIVTCWLEVPRCLIYHNSQVPVMGLVVGACQGAGMTVIRAFAGVADFASFGFMTDSIYQSCHDFGEWVWESRWVPKN
ncbi:MAG: exosortase system-associated protein, TIGR04073 family [Lentisphaerae bacterium]|nr:exosortase system-associated protein, TIGR04073 family [Lentisphaerota bacterium]